MKKLLDSQNPHKASGPDQVTPRFLKEMAPSIITVILKHHRTGGLDWLIYMRSDKCCLITGPIVLCEICAQKSLFGPNVCCKTLHFNQPTKSDI